MRLALVSRDMPPAVGGIGDYTDLLGHELSARGHDVSVLCTAPAEARTKIDVRPVLPSLDSAGIASLDAELAALRPDAILWQYNPFAMGRKGIAPEAGRMAKAMASHAPLVLVAHELWFPWAREAVRGLVWAVAQRIETVAVIRHSRRVVVTTESRLQTLRRWLPGRRDALELIPIGANFEPDPTTDPGDIRSRFGIAPDAFLIAHLGSVGAGRDLEPLYSALRTLRAEGTDVRLALIGQTGRVATPPDLSEVVTFTGVQSRADVSLLLRSSDAYAFCEPSGPAAGRKGSLLAAFSHGLSVVAYNGPDQDATLVDGENVLLVQPAGVAVANALRTLARDAGVRTRIGNAARDSYLSHYSWPVVGEAFENLLEGIR